MERLDKVLLIRVRSPLFSKYYLFHIASLLLNLSFTMSQTVIDLKATPKGRPRYLDGSNSTLHLQNIHQLLHIRNTPNWEQTIGGTFPPSSYLHLPP